VAVIGADPTGRGFGPRAHIPAVRATPGLELVAVCTAHTETARQAAQRWEIDRAYDNYLDVMSDADVDLVTISVPVRLHREIAEAAIEAGKLVYCEWPLCLNSDEAAGLARLAAERHVPCAVGTQGRFSPGVAYVKELLDRGSIGRPLTFQASQLLRRFDVQSDRSWLAREEEASGALHVATAHVTDTVRHLLGDVASLSATRATLAPDGRFSDTGEHFRWSATDTVACLLRLNNGTIGSTYVTNLAMPSVGFLLRVLGEQGQVVISAPGYVSFARTRVCLGRGDRLDELEIPDRLNNGLALAHDDPALNVGLALRAFVTAAGAGTAFHPNFDDAVVLHRVIEGIARASDDMVWIAL
jgi:predicted dehydrogenase